MQEVQQTALQLLLSSTHLQVIWAQALLPKAGAAVLPQECGAAQNLQAAAKPAMQQQRCQQVLHSLGPRGHTMIDPAMSEAAVMRTPLQDFCNWAVKVP
jgi:hypothetical protein